jgi:hypothetical protein
MTSPPVQAPGNPGMNAAPGAMPKMDRSQVSRDYATARKACDAMPAAQMGSCVTDANKKYGSVDAKCQSLSGNALTECLGVNDRVKQ